MSGQKACGATEPDALVMAGGTDVLDGGTAHLISVQVWRPNGTNCKLPSIPVSTTDRLDAFDLIYWLFLAPGIGGRVATFF